MDTMSSLVGKDIELDAVGRQLASYLTIGCVCMLMAPLWCDQECGVSRDFHQVAAKTSL